MTQPSAASSDAAEEKVEYDGLTGARRGGRERESFEVTRQDMEAVRARRDAKRICVRCTFCGRCRFGVRKKPVDASKLESL